MKQSSCLVHARCCVYLFLCAAHNVCIPARCASRILSQWVRARGLRDTHTLSSLSSPMIGPVYFLSFSSIHITHSHHHQRRSSWKYNCYRYIFSSSSVLFNSKLICMQSSMLVQIDSLDTKAFTGVVYVKGSYHDDKCIKYITSMHRITLRISYDACQTQQVHIQGAPKVPLN
jgi:hypothetical protein